MAKLNIGLIGCGNMGTGLARACNQLERAQIVAVHDVHAEAGTKLSHELDVPWYEQLEGMLAGEHLDGVIVAVPGFLHAESTVRAAEAGKHVFCEKPMAVSLEDCDAMIAACETHQVKLMIGQVCRYHAIHSKVKEMVDEGVIGEPICMVVRRLGGGFGGAWKKTWRNERRYSGGTLMEVNAHEIDFMRWVCGDVRSVHAQGGHYLEKSTDYEDVVLASLKFKSGAVGLLHSSNASAIGGYGGRLDATGGSLFFPSIWGGDAGIHWARFGEKQEFIPASDIQVENPVRVELRAFVDAILHDSTPPVTGQDGRAAVEIALAAYRSVETDETVELPLK